MVRSDNAWSRGLDALSAVVRQTQQGLVPATLALPAAAPQTGRLLIEASTVGSGPGRWGDAGQATSTEAGEPERERLIALVELARGGDAEAFGQLYDHYQPAVFRFLSYRTRSTALAEDLTSETFFKALRSMSGFRWQGRDFGAWLMTIARNLAVDHFKSSRARLEQTTDDMSLHDSPTTGPEALVITSFAHQALLDGLARLADDQRDCLTLRFLQGMSTAETAAVLGRSEGAVKQLQLRAVRSLSKLVPTDYRDG